MSGRTRRVVCLACLALAGSACGRIDFESRPTTDAGRPDAGPHDSGPGAPDAGPQDAGPPDAGPLPDAGPVDAGPPVGAIDVGTGLTHSCAVRTDGSLWCWGMNISGELGRGVIGASDPRPGPVADVGISWARVDAGANHTCAIDVDATLWCWGSNAYGQLGLGTAGDGERLVPTRVGAARDWAKIDVGVNHTCGLRASTLWCWGGTRIALGIGDGLDHFAPAQVPGNWLDVAAGSNFTCAIDDGGSLWCWGTNERGQLGLGPAGPDRAERPQRVTAGTGWLNVSAGFFHACGVTSTPRYLCWGANNQAQLGVGDRVDRNEPTDLAPSPFNPARMALGAASSFAYSTAEGRLIVWGEEPDGTVLIGPNDLGGPFDCFDAAGGQIHQCALCAMDRVWCRGRSTGVGPGGESLDWTYVPL